MLCLTLPARHTNLSAGSRIQLGVKPTSCRHTFYLVALTPSWICPTSKIAERYRARRSLSSSDSLRWPDTAAGHHNTSLFINHPRQRAPLRAPIDKSNSAADTTIDHITESGSISQLEPLRVAARLSTLKTRLFLCRVTLLASAVDVADHLKTPVARQNTDSAVQLIYIFNDRPWTTKTLPSMMETTLHESH